MLDIFINSNFYNESWIVAFTSQHAPFQLRCDGADSSCLAHSILLFWKTRIVYRKGGWDCRRRPESHWAQGRKSVPTRQLLDVLLHSFCTACDDFYFYFAWTTGIKQATSIHSVALPIFGLSYRQGFLRAAASLVCTVAPRRNAVAHLASSLRRRDA